MSYILFVPAALIIFIGFIFLQIYLSKKDNKWLGLILPVIAFLCSAIPILNIINMETAGQTAAVIIITFLCANIPTAVLMIIYFACREKYRKHSQINKMNIQDLE